MNKRMVLIAGSVAAGVLLIALGIAGISRQAAVPETGAAAVSSPAASSAVAPAPVQPESVAGVTKLLSEAGTADFFSPAAGPGDTTYTVRSGDNLTKIARKYGTTVELLRVANGIRGDMIRAGQKLRIPKADFSVLVDKSQNTLTLKNGEEVVKVYTCSTGRDGITPVGAFRVVNRLVDPVWKGIVAPGDPENPLGTRWLGFDLPQYGIHGTNEPETLGQAVTDGCIRLANNDVEELFTLLPEGTSVTVVE